MTKKIQWIVVNICRLVVSATFVFSGLVKLIDPVGTQYKIEDYAAALNLTHLAIAPVPLVLAVVLAMLEFCLGIYLFFGIRRRFTTYTILGFMILYTPLTLWLAVTNAVADCGCFGDAIVLTNWQTFWKNVILLAGAIILFWRGNLLTRFISESAQWLISLYSIIYSGFLVLLCIYAEPVIDFRPFHIGQNMRTAMEWPADPEQLPEIIDFSIEPTSYAGKQGAGIDTETLLADTSFNFLLIAPHLEQADDSNMERINAIYDYAVKGGYGFWCLTASGENSIRRWQDLTGAEYDYAFVDELTLKTMARSNPALILLHDGTIVGKWSQNLLPEEEELSGPLHSLDIATPHLASYHRMLLRLLLWYIVPLAIFTFIDRFIASVRWWRKKKRAQKGEKL
jgi:triosephosphate isomerase